MMLPQLVDRLMLMIRYSLVIAIGLVLNRRADALIRVVVVLLPLGYESVLRVHERRLCRPKPFLRSNGATARRRCYHIAILADAHRNIANVHGDFAGVRVVQGLRQRVDVIVCESQGLDLREFRVLRESRQGHSQSLQGVV